MKKEEGWSMYIDIKRLKEKGFSNSKIAKMLGISRPTVIKYIKMDPDDFEKELELRKQRTKKPDIYQNEIITWIKQYPGMTSSQVYDWLEERYREIDFNECTLRTYVRAIRIKHGIPRESEIRQYEAVDDLPMGKQMQVDFGEKKVFNTDGKEIKIYVMCFVLSHSRYKYCEWLGRPFNTADIIRIHENAFEHYGGFPEEAVYDQDHLILVSENHGELVYTKEFAAYLQNRKFAVHMCRKSDPESKGRVEKVVDFVKENFASNRIFYSIDRWNEGCLKWLMRRGNGKTHGTTRKIPAEVFIEEKKHLRPVVDKIISKIHGISITYQVRKDNTVPIQGNRYTVPKGTYKGPHTYVGINKVENRILIIFDLDDGTELGRFEIPESKGNLVRNNDHKRDKSGKIPQMMESTSSKFSDKEKAQQFLEGIHKTRPRYTRDQIMLIESAIKSGTADSMDKALDYCIKNSLFSAVDFRDAAKHYTRTSEGCGNNEESPSLLTVKATKTILIKTQVRDMAEYIKIMNSGVGK